MNLRTLELVLLAWQDALWVLALGVLLMVGIAAVVARQTLSARKRRSVWQAAVLGILLLTIGEATGVSQAAVAWILPPAAKNAEHAVLSSAPAASPSQVAQAALPTIIKDTAAAVPIPSASQWLVDRERADLLKRAAEASASAASVSALPEERTHSPGDDADTSSQALSWTMSPGSAVTKLPATDAGAEIVSVLVRLYLAVVGALMIHLLLGYVRLLCFRARLNRCSAGPDCQQLEDIARQFGLRRRVQLATSNEIASPLALGLWRPMIVVPVDFARRYTQAQRQVMLAHEAAHHASHDLAWRLLAEILCRVLWFHPAVWYARVQLATAMEHAADEASLMVEDGPGVLAECLVTLGRQLQRQRNLGWLGIAAGEFRSTLGQRVQRLLVLNDQPYVARPSVAKRALVLLATSAVVIAAVFCTAWARSNTSISSGDDGMTALQRSWRHSLAGLTLLTLGGSAVLADDAPSGPPEPHAVALVADDGDGPKEGEARRDGDRPRPEGPRDGEGPRREGPRDGERRPDGPPREGDRPRPDGPRPEGPRPEGPPPPREGGPHGEIHRRVHHLIQAAMNLEAAGLREQAAEIRSQADRLRREAGIPEGPPPRREGDRPDGPPREGDRPRPDGPRPDGPPPRDGDRPRPDGPRPEGPPREGDRPHPEGPLRDGDRPRPEGPPREGDRPRPEGPPREGDRPRPDGPPREGERPPGPRPGGSFRDLEPHDPFGRRPEGPPPGSPDMLRVIEELRAQITQLRQEVEILRAKSVPEPK